MVFEIQQVSNMISKRLKRDKDLCIAITADEGSGKSSLAIQLAMAMDSSFSLEKNIIFSPNFEELKSKIVGLEPYTPVILDESIKLLYKYFWQQRNQQMTNVLMALARQENKALFMLMPKLSDFNPFFRNRRIKIWIHIIKEISPTDGEGKAIIFLKSKNPFNEDDVWHFKDNADLINNYCRSKHTTEAMLTWEHYHHLLAKSRNYLGLLDFGLMPDGVFENYKALKRKFAYDDLNVEGMDKKGKREILWQRRTQLLMRFVADSGKTYTEIGEILGVTQQQVSRIMTEEV